MPRLGYKIKKGQPSRSPTIRFPRKDAACGTRTAHPCSQANIRKAALSGLIVLWVNKAIVAEKKKSSSLVND